MTTNLDFAMLDFAAYARDITQSYRQMAAEKTGSRQWRYRLFELAGYARELNKQVADLQDELGPLP